MKQSIDSFCVREHKDTKTTPPHQLPIYATSSFTFEHIEDSIDIFTGKAEGHVYSRYGNPTVDTVAAKIAAMEAFDLPIEAYGFMTSSGMSAISTLLYALCNQGDKVLTQANIYGGTTELFNKILSRHGIDPVFMKFDDLAEVENCIINDPTIKVIYLETPSNPTLDCVDLKTIADLAKKHQLLTVIDNTFCTPYLQQPFQFGIDFIIHSTTKYLNGHGNSIAGIIVGHDPAYKTKIKTTLKLIGSTCNPWDAWLTNNGLKTLAIRMEKHSNNAIDLAKFLEAHPKVTKVNYLGLPSHKHYHISIYQMNEFGGMLSFTIDGDLKTTLQFINHLKMCSQAPTLGDVDTLVLHPATSSHLNVDRSIRESFGITDNMVRVSVGIESRRDIIADFEQALDLI